MKKIYEKPDIQKVEFNYQDQVVAASGSIDVKVGWKCKPKPPHSHYCDC